MPATQKPKVLIADSSKMNCQLLAHSLQYRGNFQVVAYATEREEAILKILEYEPDVAVINSRLQEDPSAGLTVLRKLRESHAGCRAILLLDENWPQSVVEAFRNGARGVFCRTDGASNLRKCIEVVHRGEVWMGNEHIESVVEALRQAPAPKVPKNGPGEGLTKRQEQVARLVADGLSNREIAAQGGLSQHTVKNHLLRIYEKLGISTRTELTLYILARGKLAQTDHPVETGWKV